MPCDCPVEESEHPCSDVSYRENSSAHPKGMSLMTQPEVQNFVYRLYVVSQNSFKRLSPWDWERKALGGNSKGSVGLTRPLKGLYEAFQKTLRDSFSGWQEKSNPRQESPERQSVWPLSKISNV